MDCDEIAARRLLFLGGEDLWEARARIRACLPEAVRWEYKYNTIINHSGGGFSIRPFVLERVFKDSRGTSRTPFPTKTRFICPMNTGS